MRIILPGDPYPEAANVLRWHQRGIWPAYWITLPDAPPAPWVAAFRRRFTVDEYMKARIHVTADERYELLFNGLRVGRGPERGDPANWFFESYEIEMQPGEHELLARVWAMGRQAPKAQMSVSPGFLLSSHDHANGLLATGRSEWQVAQLHGCRFRNNDVTYGIGADIEIDAAAWCWDRLNDSAVEWREPQVMQTGFSAGAKVEGARQHLLRPATLPAMIERPVKGMKVRHVEAVDTIASEARRDRAVRQVNHLADDAPTWQAMVDGDGRVTVESGQARRIIIDLDDYYCAYPSLVTTGGKGTTIKLSWAESLFLSPEMKHDRHKGNRDEIEGKHFVGITDTWLLDGGDRRRLDTLWWKAGRYLELTVQAGDQPVTIERFTLSETRYPLEDESAFEASDQRLTDIVPIMHRCLQMCAHETYYDCPYYEQLMYVGDTRLQVLTTYVTTHDSRLPRKAIEMFQASRMTSGLTQSRYPSNDTQVIPPFSLWWIGMVYDFALWRDEAAFVRRMMPTVRGVLDYFISCINDAGLVQRPNGWNYTDWVKDQWNAGVPPEGEFGESGPINWQTILALTYAVELEQWLGETEMAARWDRVARELTGAVLDAFWDDDRQRLADTRDKQHASEHSQCLALLADTLDTEKANAVAKALLEHDDLAEATIYFRHYPFEAYRQLQRVDRFFDGLSLWHSLKANGLRTTIEAPEPTRSDCHAWGAHPIYHYFASVLGIRPGHFGFDAVDIRPQLGNLGHARGRMPHPNGWIEVDFERDGDQIKGTIALPDDTVGLFTQGDQTQRLVPGEQTIA